MIQPIQCPKCGNQIPPGTNFCGYCGNRLIIAAQPQQNKLPQQQNRYQQQKGRQKNDGLLNIIVIVAIIIFVIGLGYFIYTSLYKADTTSSIESPLLPVRLSHDMLHGNDNPLGKI